MKILILGATGATGKNLIEQAVKAGHDVTAYVRNPAKLLNLQNKIHIIPGELHDAIKLTEAVKGQDAVLSSLGYKNLFDKSLFVSKAIQTVINAMNLYGVKKIVYESASGVGGKESVSNPVLRFFLNLFHAANPFKDHFQVETILKNSAVNWTIIRPGMLTNGSLKGKYRSGVNLKRTIYISRADVAHCMLQAIDDKEMSNKSLDLSY
jgi:putative NADH-flavin reductase